LICAGAITPLRDREIGRHALNPFWDTR